jgi:hypothetical protein
MYKAKMCRDFLAFVVVATLLAAASPALADGFFVIVHRTNTVSSLSKSDLKKLFSGGTKQWESGAVVQVGLITVEAAEPTFLASLFDMTPRELLQRIQEQVFKGEMRRPVVLRSSAECVALARSNPGGVCVASSLILLSPDVRVVLVR